jgi:hypothetical protein
MSLDPIRVGLMGLAFFPHWRVLVREEIQQVAPRFTGHSSLLFRPRTRGFS